MASGVVFLARQGWWGKGTLEQQLPRAHEAAAVFVKGKSFVPGFTVAGLGLESNLGDWPVMAGKAALIKHLIDWLEW